MGKVCSKCRRELEFEAFSVSVAVKDGRQPYCKNCIAQYLRDNPGKPFHKMVRSAVQHKLDKGRSDLITPEQVETLYGSQGGLCAYTGRPVPLDYLTQPHHPQAPSLERIDCSEAHTLENCIIIARYLNTARMHTDLPTFLRYLDGMDGHVAPGFTRDERLVA